MSRLLPVALLTALVLTAPALAANRTASLNVRSKPAGATVWVDGAPVGQTPFSLAGLQPGAYTVVVGAPGHRLWSKRVQVRRGKSNVEAKLKLASGGVAEGQKAELKALLEANAAPALEWKRLASVIWDVAGEVPGLDGLRNLLPAGARLRAAGVSQVEGYYLQVSTTASGATATFYLDEAKTQVAGQVAVSHSGFDASVDYSFTGGAFAGASGHLSASLSGLTRLVLDGQGVFGDGSEWTADLDIRLDESSGSLTGELNLVRPGGITAAVKVEVSATDGDLRITTSSGYRLEVDLNPDGSGGGTVFGPGDPGALAVFSWTPDGHGTITFSDGSTESF